MGTASLPIEDYAEKSYPLDSFLAIANLPCEESDDEDEYLLYLKRK